MTNATAALSPLAEGLVGLYGALAPYQCGPVSLTEIRKFARIGVEREDVDAALRELADLDGVHLLAQCNQQLLTDADREAALRLGGEDRHNLQIEWVEIED